MVGQKAAVPAEQILEKLLEFNIYEDDILIARSNDLWKDVCHALDDLIHHVNVYLNYVFQFPITIRYLLKLKNLNITRSLSIT